MSRSYKKNPVLTEPSTNHRYHPRSKAIANRVVRRHFKQDLRQHMELNNFDELVNLNGTAYKQYFPSYDINDYAFDLRDYSLSERLRMNAAQVRKYFRK